MRHFTIAILLNNIMIPQKFFFFIMNLKITLALFLDEDPLFTILHSWY